MPGEVTTAIEMFELTVACECVRFYHLVLTRDVKLGSYCNSVYLIFKAYKGRSRNFRQGVCVLWCGGGGVHFVFVCFVLLFYVPINSYGHGETVSSLNHTFSWASLNNQ